MVNVMQRSMMTPGRAVALALALAPLAAAPARAQQDTHPTLKAQTRICVDGRCTEETAHVLVIRLQGKVDSLQRIFLGQPISPEERIRLKSQMEEMIRRLAVLQPKVFTYGLQQAEEASREAAEQAMAESNRVLGGLAAMPPIPPDAAPKGWIGLTFVGAPIATVRNNEYYVRFLDYPQVETVEPASPAERAGIMSGDQLLAFNGKDVTTQAISMTRLLQPDHKIVVRLERNGRPHDYSLVVAKAPRNYASRFGDFGEPGPVVLPAPPQSIEAPKALVVGPGGPTRFFTERIAFPNGFDSERGVAGAELSTLNPDLARNLNLSATHGVMVIDAPVGTPAARSGLQAGDVIVKAAGSDVSSVQDLRRILEWHSADSTVELQIVRKGHRHTIKFDNE